MADVNRLRNGLRYNAYVPDTIGIPVDMLFNSFSFGLFFPFVVLLYFNMHGKAQVTLLMVASCIFYMAFVPEYILILFATILVDYYAGIRISETQGTTRRRYLIASIISTCGILFVFKYINFFADTVTQLAAFAGFTIRDLRLQIVLPIGLSFHTFQSLSYVIEVYRGQYKAEKSLLLYSTYVMFFPQLVAGPIERPQNLLQQFHADHDLDTARIAAGLRRMAWGFFKKLVIADRLALYVNDVYGSPAEHNGLQLTLATVFFAYQIYCDFSGYTDIALGTAKVMGFTLMENFDTPYYAASIGEFWRRWHISLSSWFRDYVYVPLGGSRSGMPTTCRNLMITFALSGLWHGASWTYICWGALNGFYVICGVVFGPFRQRCCELTGLSLHPRLRRAIGIINTLILTLGAWVFFRATDIQDAMYILTHFHSGWDFRVIGTEHFLMRQMPAAILGVLILEVVQLASKRYDLNITILSIPQPFRWLIYICAVLGVTLLGIFKQTEFIYFQF